MDSNTFMLRRRAMMGVDAKPKRTCVVLSNNMLFMTTDDFATMTQVAGIPLAHAVAMCRSNPLYQSISAVGGIHITADGWKTFRIVLPYTGRIAICPSDPRIQVAGVSRKLYITNNLWETYREVDLESHLVYNENIAGIAISGSNPNIQSLWGDQGVSLYTKNRWETMDYIYNEEDGMNGFRTIAISPTDENIQTGMLNTGRLDMVVTKNCWASKTVRNSSSQRASSVAISAQNPLNQFAAGSSNSSPYSLRIMKSTNANPWSSFSSVDLSSVGIWGGQIAVSSEDENIQLAVYYTGSGVVGMGRIVRMTKDQWATSEEVFTAPGYITELLIS